MFTKFKAWLQDTKKYFKEFFIHQSGILIGLTALYIGSYVAGHFIVLYSEPYSLTENFIKTNPATTEVVGTVNSVSLQPLANKIKWTNSDARAELEINVNGNKTSCQVKAYLEKVDGKWSLLKAHALLPNHDVFPLKQ